MSSTTTSDGNTQSLLIRLYTPNNEEPHSSIVPPGIGENYFELNPSLMYVVQWNQLRGSLTDEPNLYVSIFAELCDTTKIYMLNRK